MSSHFLRRFFPFGFLVFLAFSACTTVIGPAGLTDPDTMSKFHVGRTTENQVIEALGNPTSTVPTPDGTTIVYDQKHILTLTAITLTKEVQETFEFDKKGVLQKMTRHRIS